MALDSGSSPTVQSISWGQGALCWSLLGVGRGPRTWDVACPRCPALRPRKGVCSGLGSTRRHVEVLAHGPVTVALGGCVIRGDRLRRGHQGGSAPARGPHGRRRGRMKTEAAGAGHVRVEAGTAGLQAASGAPSPHPCFPQAQPAFLRGQGRGALSPSGRRCWRTGRAVWRKSSKPLGPPVRG